MFRRRNPKGTQPPKAVPRIASLTTPSTADAESTSAGGDSSSPQTTQLNKPSAVEVRTVSDASGICYNATTVIGDQNISVEFSQLLPSEDADTVNSKDMYNTAIRKLKKALKVRRNEWGSFEFPELDALSEQDIWKIQTEVDKVLTTRRKSLEDPKGWLKCKAIMEHAFMAFTPFAKNALNVAGAANAVAHCVSGIILDRRIKSVRHPV